MKLLTKRLIFIGALAILVSGVLAMIGTDFSGLFSSGSGDPQSQRTGYSSFLPLERAVFAASEPQAQQLPGQMMAEDAFENIQVLGGIPVDEFMGTMGLFSARTHDTRRRVGRTARRDVNGAWGASVTVSPSHAPERTPRDDAVEASERRRQRRQLLQVQRAGRST